MVRKRRGRGEGSIHQRAEDGLWVVTASLGYDAQGKRRRVTAYGTTKREAQDNLKAKLEAAGGAIPADAGRLTVGAYLKSWLASIDGKVQPNTLAPYERHVRLHITPYIGTIKLRKLEPLQVKGLYAALTRAGVSAAMQKKVGTTLAVALNAAIGDHLIKYNATVGVRKPKATPPEMQVSTPTRSRRSSRRPSPNGCSPCT